MIQNQKEHDGSKHYTQISSQTSILVREDRVKKLHAAWSESGLEKDNTEVGFHFVVDYIEATADPRVYKTYFFGQDFNETDIPSEILQLIGDAIKGAGLTELEFGQASLKVNKDGKPLIAEGSANGYRFVITADGKLKHQMGYYDTGCSDPCCC